MRKKKVKTPLPPPHGPNQRAQELNHIACQKVLPTLPDNELAYVNGIRWTLRRYQRNEICANQAQAEQRMWQIAYLQGGIKK